MEFENLIENIDKKRNNEKNAKRNIIKIMQDKEVDIPPFLFWKSKSSGSGTAVNSVPGNTYNMKEQFMSKDKMLYGHLEEIESIAEYSYDSIFCIRPNFGTIFIPAIFDLEYNVPENDFPWLINHFTKKDIKNIKVPKLDNNEMMNKAIDYIEYFKVNLPDWIHVYLPDTQGPFDLAHLLYGNDIFIDLYEDPEFVHEFLEMITEVYIKVTRKLKEVVGEENNECYHGHARPRGIYMNNGGTRISEDTATLISPEHIDEFVIPYDKKCLEAFEGGFIHYCGEHQYLLEAYLKLELVKAVNLGNPEKYDFEKTMQKFMKYGKCYFGLWPKEVNETIDDYISRMIKATKTDCGYKGLLLHFDQEMFPEFSAEKIHKRWQKSFNSSSTI